MQINFMGNVYVTNSAKEDYGYYSSLVGENIKSTRKLIIDAIKPSDKDFIIDGYSYNPREDEQIFSGYCIIDGKAYNASYIQRRTNSNLEISEPLERL